MPTFNQKSFSDVNKRIVAYGSGLMGNFFLWLGFDRVNKLTLGYSGLNFQLVYSVLEWSCTGVRPSKIYGFSFLYRLITDNSKEKKERKKSEVIQGRENKTKTTVVDFIANCFLIISSFFSSLCLLFTSGSTYSVHWESWRCCRNMISIL